MDRRRIGLLIAIVTLVAVFFALDLDRWLSLDVLKAQRDALLAWRDGAPLAASALFFAVYVAATGLSLPGAAVLTLAAGAIFGLLWGTLLVSFASTLGATLAFLSARFVLGDWVRRHWRERLRAIDAGMEKDGPFYLFTLRLVPVVPFFLINLAMGLTRLRVSTFFRVSQLGMLPGTLVYVNAGTELAGVEALADIVSPGLLLSFALLGIFPFIARRAADWLRRRRALARWPRPARFDRNLVVIGGGSAGLVTAYIAAAVGARVSLVEKHQLGGDCLNTGCVPSKALIRTTRLLAELKRAGDYGLREARAEFDFAEVMERVQAVIRQVEPHDSAERYRGLGVDVIEGTARLTSPWTVAIDTPAGTRQLTTRAIVVATGARPFVPPIAGLDEVGYLTSDTVWNLRQRPERLLVLGGGPIGCELAQAFARLGSRVIQVEMADQLMGREDPDVAEAVMARFRAEGVDLRLQHAARRFAVENGEKVLYAEHGGSEVRIVFDQLLVAVGRAPNARGLGLEALGATFGPRGTLDTDARLRSAIPTVWACGDVAGPYQFTHTAAHQAWYAAVNALFGGWRSFRVDYSVIPWATFTDPEVARVGLNETEARAAGVAHEVTRYAIDDLDRAIADGEAHGFVKVLTVPGRDRILGATIVGAQAGELIGEFVSAMKHGHGLNQILDTIHVYPTLLEANKYAAGQWKRDHAPARLLEWVRRYHAWRLG